jgi:hypothetical protein
MLILERMYAYCDRPQQNVANLHVSTLGNTICKIREKDSFTLAIFSRPPNPFRMSAKPGQKEVHLRQCFFKISNNCDNHSLILIAHIRRQKDTGDLEYSYKLE